MSKNIFQRPLNLLAPGTPDDANREYLPERIKGSDIVVNENGNNSQPYPNRLIELCEPLLDDEKVDVWYEYVPSSYTTDQKVPLVISLHGGLMTGWGQAIYTSWTRMAEQHGFIVALPNASERRVWCVNWGKWRHDDQTPGVEEAPGEIPAAPESVGENRDIRLLLALIAKLKQKYNIDEERVFMQGMSMGDLMTSLFTRYYGHVLAGSAGSGCSTFPSRLFTHDGKIINQAGPVDVWQSRPEHNDIPPDQALEKQVNKINRYYWMRINQCDLVPEISIVGEHNFAFYKGAKANLTYLDIRNRDHGQTFDDAALVWNYLFSGSRRATNGALKHSQPNSERRGDQFSIAVASGAKSAWLNNKIVPMVTTARKWKKLKYHGLNGAELVRGEYLCVPLSFLAEAFKAKYALDNSLFTAKLTLADGRVLQFARGSIGCVIDKTLRSMYCEALYRDNELLVSIEWFCRYLFNLHVSTSEDVVYLTDHHAELSAGMADLINDLLKSDGRLPDFEVLS